MASRRRSTPKRCSKRGDVVFDELRQGISDIEFLTNPNVGEVRIGCPESLAFVSSAIIDRLSRRYPEVVVRVVTAQPATLEFRELRERKVDLLLGRISLPLVDDDVDVEILFEDRLFVVTGSRNRWTRRQRIDLAELMSERWLLLPANNVLSSLIAQAFEARGLDPPRECVSADVHTRLHLLTTGRFLTFVPDSLLQFVAKRWSLKALPVDLSIQGPSLGIITLRNRTVSPVVQLFIESAREVAKSIARTSRRRKS